MREIAIAKPSPNAHRRSLPLRRVPFLVAHRAGNQLDLLRAAEAEHCGAIVEADVNLFRGRLEIRHLKTLGRLPVFWDRWQLAPPWRAHLLLSDLLATASPETELMLDLKGKDLRLAERVIEELEPYLGQRRLTICTRAWPVNDLTRAAELARLGVDGLISDRPGAISGLAAPEATG